MTDARPPLAGLTVLVPRARGQASGFSALLRARGAEPLEVPTIEIRPVASTAELDRAVEDLAAGRYDWVVLTSVNGVAAVRARAEALGHGAPAIARASVAAVGPATEAALRDWGIVPDRIHHLADAAGMKQTFIQGVSVAVIAEIEPKDLETGLVQDGGRGEDVVGVRAAFPTVQQNHQPS